ncbi:MAG: cytochrome c oxidase assembly protein [Gaiellaceae bacterium]
MRPEPYSWNSHIEVAAALAALGLGYALAMRRHPAPPWRIACFALGGALLLATAVTPLDALSYHLLVAHLLQNVVLAEWAPLLIVLGLPPALAAALGAVPAVRPLTHPAVALPLWLATYFLWHLPLAYDAALEHDALLHLEHATYFVTGCLLWWPVIHDQPRRLQSSTRAVYLFAAFLLGSPLGLLLALLPEPVYAYYEEGERLWGLSALMDQQIAGITMSAEQAVVFFAGFTLFFFRFMREEEEREELEPTS